MYFARCASSWLAGVAPRARGRSRRAPRRRRGTPRSRRWPGSASSASPTATRVRSGSRRHVDVAAALRGAERDDVGRGDRGGRSRALESQGVMPSTDCGSVRQCDQPYGRVRRVVLEHRVAATRKMATARPRRGPAAATPAISVRAGPPPSTWCTVGKMKSLPGQTEARRVGERVGRTLAASAPRASIPSRIHSMRSSGRRATSRTSGRSSASAARLPAAVRSRWKK